MREVARCKRCFAGIIFVIDSIGRVSEHHPDTPCIPPPNYTSSDDTSTHPLRKRRCETCLRHYYPTDDWPSKVACSDICRLKRNELRRLQRQRQNARRKEA